MKTQISDKMKRGTLLERLSLSTGGKTDPLKRELLLSKSETSEIEKLVDELGKILWSFYRSL